MLNVQIKAKGNFREQVQKIAEGHKARFHKAVISRLSFIGENFVKRARESGNYTDRTGNLRSSIGFLVVANGAVVAEGFELSKKGTDKVTGMNTSVELANELASKYRTGYALIVVAGMEYAAAVESKDYDVLTGASSNLEAELRQAIQDLNTK